MPSVPPLAGFHHATSFAGDPETSIRFHKEVLGMELVKRTVNFDEPGAQHLYFSNKKGEPGTILTTFPGYHRRPTVRQNLVIGLQGGSESKTLHDPDGMEIEMMPGEGPLRLYSAAIRTAQPQATIAFFVETLGFQLVSDGDRAHLEGYGARVDVVADPQVTRPRFGAGITHHVAFCVEDESTQLRWREHLIQSGVRVSLVKDRHYFHSIYFREPSGILLEIATRGPGFQIDEAPGHLGESLRLPPWFEPIRESIETRLAASEFKSAEPHGA